MMALDSPTLMPSLEPSSPLPSHLSASSPSSPISLSSSHSSSDDDLPLSLEEVIADDDDEEGEEGDEDDEEDDAPCERFFVNLKTNGPYISLKRLRTRLANSSKPSPSPSSSSPPSLLDDDVQVTQVVVSTSRRPPSDDAYDTSDPFIDDAELPAERDDDAVQPLMDGFYVQRGAVVLKDAPPDIRVKRESTSDPHTKKKKRSISFADTGVPMSPALLAAFAALEAACREADVLASAEVSHRRLPDDVNALFSEVIRVYEEDVSELRVKGSRAHRPLMNAVVGRLEAALGMTRPSIRQKMKNLKQKWVAQQRLKDIGDITARLKANIQHDVTQHKAKLLASNFTAASQGPPDAAAVVYKPKWTLLMPDLLQLSALTLQEAGAKLATSGNPLETEGQQVQRELWEKLADSWGGLMDAKTLGERVRSARRARRKKEQEKAKAAEGVKASKRSAEEKAEEKMGDRSGKDEATSVGRQQPSSTTAKDASKAAVPAPAHKPSAEDDARRMEKWLARKEKKRKKAEAAAVTAASSGGQSTVTSSSSHSGSKDKDGEKRKKKKHRTSTSASPSSSSDKGKSSSSKSKSSAAPSPSLSLQSVLPPSSTVFHQPPDPSVRWSQRFFPITIGLSGAPPPPSSSSSARPPLSGAALSSALLQKAKKKPQQQTATR